MDNKHSTDTETVAAKVSSASDPVQHKPRDVAQDSSTSANSKDAGISAANKPIEKSVPSQSAAPATASLNDTDTKISAENDKSKEKIESKATKSLSTSKSVDVVPEKQPGKDERKGTANSADQSASVNKTGDKSTKTTTSASDTGGKPKGNETITPVTGSTEVDPTTKKTEEANKDVSSKTEIPPEKLNPQASTGKEASAVNQIQSVEAKNTKEEGESKKNKSRFSFRRLVGKGESKKKDQNSNASGAIIEDQEKSGAVVGEADAVVEDVNKPVDVPARPTQQQQQPQPQPQADESKEKSALKSDKREKKPEVVGQKIAEKPIVKKSESNPTTAVKDDMTKIEPIKEKEKLLPDKKTPISISDEGVQNEKQISEQEAEVEISSGPQDHEGSEGAVQNDIDKEGEKEALEETFPRFRRNRRQKAELEGHSGGEPVSVLDDNEYALKIQSSWRGKVIRKQIKRQNIAAADIQRVYKGRLDRKKYMQNLQQHNDSARAAKTRQERLKKIRAKEKELRLLSTIPAEDFLNYERIKENNNAKVIQRAWRRTDKSYATIGKESAQSNRRSFDEVEYHSKRAFKTTGYHQPKRKQDGVERPDAKDLPRPYPDSQEKRKEIILSQIISKSEQIATVTPRPDSSSRPTSARERHAVTFDVDALTLAQLHRRISDKAAIRNKEREFRGTRSGFRPRANKYGTLDLNDTVQDSIDRATAKSTNIFSKTRQNLQGATEAKRKSHHHSSARQKYQDLSEVQLRASVMMQEHAYAKELMTERQAERLKAIGHCKYLVNKLSNPLSLDEAKKLLTADPKTLEKEDIEKSWYITEESQSYDTSVGQEQIKNAIEIHLKTAQTMRDRDHWGVVTIPLNNNIAHANVAAAIYVDKTLDGTEDAESRKHLKLRDANFVSVDRSLEGFGSRKRNNDGKTFRPLVSDWADGKDVEESMYWITYASQPTKILAPVAKDEVEVADRTASAIVDQSVEAITAARLRVDKNALVKQITHEAMNYPRRRQEISAKLQAESDYIGRKAQQYLDQAINEYHQMKLSKAQEKLSAEMQERQLRAAIRIQALFRGKYNRVKSAKLRSERRVLVALQNLLAEIANNDTQQQVKARRFSTPGTLNQSFSGDRGGPKPHSSLILDYFAKIPDISRSMQAGRAPSLSATEEAGKGKKTADLVAKSKATTSFKVESVNSQKKQPAVDSTWLSSSMRESSILKNAWTSTSPFVPTAFDHQEFNRTPRSTAYEIGESHATTPASEPPGPYSLPYLSAGNTFSPFVHDSQSNKEAIIGSPANYGGIASSAVSEPSSPITARSNRSNLTMEDDHREHKEPRPPSESPSARGKPRGNLKVGSSPVSDRRQASGRQLHSPSSKRVTMLSSIAETEDSLSNPASKTPPEYHTPPKLRIPEEVYDVINSAHSDRLSEYSGGADVLDGYISPPSHSNSRSFGQSSSLQGITIGSRVAGSHVRQDVDLEVSDNSYFSPHKKQGKNIGTGKKVNPLDEDFDDDYLQGLFKFTVMYHSLTVLTVEG